MDSWRPAVKSVLPVDSKRHMRGHTLLVLLTAECMQSVSYICAPGPTSFGAFIFHLCILSLTMRLVFDVFFSFIFFFFFFLFSSDVVMIFFFQKHCHPFFFFPPQDLFLIVFSCIVANDGCHLEKDLSFMHDSFSDLCLCQRFNQWC